jgi:CDP-diacylglycerol--glycerol-3-phosphate 3-phosphatidyltransferase
MVFLQDPTPFYLHLSVLLFIFAAVTDLLDGFIARRFGAVSEFGKLIDPLADKLLVMTVLVLLVAQRGDLTGAPWVPGWMVVLVLAREIWVTGLRGIAAARGLIIAASDSGKIKSALQMAAILFLLLHDIRIPVGPYLLTGKLLGVYGLAVSLVFSYWGAVEYTIRVLDFKSLFYISSE